MRNVGDESKKTYQEKLDNGFFKKYMSGIGTEAGSSGYTNTESILETATAINLDTPGYDGTHLLFADGSLDYFYSSHVLEHVSNYKEVLKEWFRVLKAGGHLVVVVPHCFLYEKKLTLPSRFNEDHRRMYTPASLLKEVEESLLPNSYRVRYLQDDDAEFDYSIPPEKHSNGEYAITLVLQKIQQPTWSVT